MLKRFAFWLPLLAVLNYIFILVAKPVKHIVLGIDHFSII